MPLSGEEKRTRSLVEDIYATLSVKSVSQKASIAKSAFMLFWKTLLPKLNNLQEGESLQITLRVDILTSTGKVRGGKGIAALCLNIRRGELQCLSVISIHAKNVAHKAPLMHTTFNHGMMPCFAI